MTAAVDGLTGAACTAAVTDLVVPAYGASPIRRSRRSQSHMAEIRTTLVEILEAGQPMTVRQVFYQMVSRGAIDKTEGEYKRTVCRLLTEMRLDGVIPFGWIADNTRWMRKPRTHGSAGEALAMTAKAYRRALWNDQEAYVEIWCEKDALAGVLNEVTNPWDVPLLVTRGYPSLTYLAEAADTIGCQDRPVFLYYFGDFDPSGVDIPRYIQARLRELAPEIDIAFKVVGVTEHQIWQWDLPTRPTKTSDSRARDFEGKASVELDAIPPDQLRALVEHCITQHIDPTALERTRRIEKAERDSLLALADTYDL